jgi:hypothetical protein
MTPIFTGISVPGVDFSQFEPKKMRFGRDLRQMRAFL